MFICLVEALCPAEVEVFRGHTAVIQRVFRYVLNPSASLVEVVHPRGGSACCEYGGSPAVEESSGPADFGERCWVEFEGEVSFDDLVEESFEYCWWAVPPDGVDDNEVCAPRDEVLVSLFLGFVFLEQDRVELFFVEVDAFVVDVAHAAFDLFVDIPVVAVLGVWVGDDYEEVHMIAFTASTRASLT